MKTWIKFGSVGVFLLLTCGPVLAHDRFAPVVYPDSGWSGSVTVWGDSTGYSGLSGAAAYSYGVAYGYAPGYIPWTAAHRHGPRCVHVAGHAYAKAYQKGYRDGRRHSNRSDHRHGYRH